MDAYQVQGMRIASYGCRNEAVRYALAMLAFSPSITIVTNGQSPVWDGPYETFVAEYGVSVRVEAVRGAVDRGCRHADDS